jgi:FkbM family methyltransferase
VLLSFSVISRIEGKLGQFLRLIVCSRRYGWINSLKMVVRVGSTTSKRTLSLPRGLRFTFRGKQDFGVLTHLFKEGYYLEDSPERRIRRVMDCGANIGVETARFFCHHPGAEIIAVEPAASNFAVLEENFGAIRDVKVVFGGVWSSDSYLTIIPPADANPESFRVMETDETHGEVKAYAIPTLMGMMGWDEIDILKLDVEGAEHELFTRNYECWVNKVNAFVFEVPDSDHPGTTQEIYKRLAASSWNTFVCGENLVLIKSGLPWKLRRVLGVAPAVAPQ